MKSLTIEITPKYIIHPDTVGVYAYMFNADHANNRKRLQAVADKVGFIILGADLFDQDSPVIFDLKARQALRPGPNFINLSKRRAEQMQTLLDGFDKRIGIGHSLGGVAITGMQRYGEVKPFNAVELKDAVNLRAPQGLVAGHLGYSTYILRDSLLHAKAMLNSSRSRDGDVSFDLNPDVQQVGYFKKIVNFSELMRSTESVDDALAVAADRETKLHFIGYTHGLSGSQTDLGLFADELARTRHQACSATDLGIAENETAEGIKISLEPGWHSDLTNASSVARHLIQTHAMLELI